MLNKPLNKYFDHTLLKPEATQKEIDKLCEEAKEYDFFSVCVNTCYAERCVKNLRGSDVKVACVVGFPLGACTTETKIFETEEAFKAGASEVDMVLNVGFFKDGKNQDVINDIKAVVETAHKYNGITKVILETCLLTEEEISKATELSVEAGAEFVKTSTGFNSAGAKKEDVKNMKASSMGKAQVKASGSIRTLKTVLEMIEAGADRIGASKSVDIMKEFAKTL